MRVLHLVDAADAALMLSLTEAAAADRSIEHVLWVVGAEGPRGRGAEGKATTTDRGSCLASFSSPSPRVPRSLLCAARRLRRSGAQVVHNWLRRRVPKLLLPAGAAMVWTPGGRDADQLLDPAVEPQRIQRGRRDALRMRWGVTEPDACVVAALGDAHRTDALLSMLAVGLAAETSRPIRLLISPRARGLHRARRVVRNVGRERLMIVDEAAERPWEVLDGCDLMLATEPSAARAWGLAAGLPDVQAICTRKLSDQADRDARAVASGEAEDEPARVIRGSAWAGELARVMCRLFDRREEAAAAAEDSRREAAARYAPARIARHLAALYRQG